MRSLELVHDTGLAALRLYPYGEVGGSAAGSGDLTWHVVSWLPRRRPRAQQTLQQVEPSSLLLSPGGDFVYTCDRALRTGTGVIGVFRVGVSGVLTGSMQWMPTAG